MRTHSLLIINRFTLVALLLALVASAVQVTPVYAASIVVNSDADTQAHDGRCSLSEAIIAANINAASGPIPGECAAGSPAGVDSISFAGNFIITLGSQLPFVTTAMTITGRGAGNTIIQAAGSPNVATWRVFQVTATGNLTLDGVTVRHGRCNGACTVVGNVEPDAGGGIYNSGILTVTNSLISENRGTLGGGVYNNQGTMTVTNSIVSDNRSSQVTNENDGGGGIRNSGNLTVMGSTISNNTATAGGGILNDEAILTVTDSIVSDNTASSGGGIFSFNGTLTVTNSTISGNRALDSDGGGLIAGGTVTMTSSTISGNNANGDGGAMFNAATLTITNSTISGNMALGASALANAGLGTVTVTNSTIARNIASLSQGNAIRNFGMVTLSNSIVANNTGGNCEEAITNGGNNLDDDTTCGFGSNNGSMSNTDPKLAFTLANNGGPTQTLKLLAGSPAIDKGNASFCSASPVNGVDQRGVNRPLGAGCDIGAYETSNGAGPDTAGVFRPSNGILFLKHSNTSGFADLGLNYGIPGDYPVVGDWDGDGDATIGVYRNGSFYLRNSNTIGFADIVFPFGNPGDQPIAGDWDGDGDDTIGVFRPSNGQFFLRNSNSAGNADISFFLGNVGDVGIAGDWNGDGMDTTGVFRPVNGILFLKNTNSTGFADVALNYGIPGDKPVTGDWNYDGIDTIGVYRNGRFFLRNSNTIGFADIVFDLGNPGDHPIAGNWDGVP